MTIIVELATYLALAIAMAILASWLWPDGEGL